MKSVSVYVVRDVHISVLLEVILYCTGSTYPIRPCTKGQIPVLVMAWRYCTTSHSWDCAGRPSKPSGNGMYWCAVLEELSYLNPTTSVGSRYCLMLPVVKLTLAIYKTSKKTVWKGKKMLPTKGKTIPVLQLTHYYSFRSVTLVLCLPSLVSVSSPLFPIFSQSASQFVFLVFYVDSLLSCVRHVQFYFPCLDS